MKRFVGLCFGVLCFGTAFASGAWRSVGPGGGGCVLSLEFSRHHPNRLYAGCDVGGFYRSEDRGRRFEMCNTGLFDLRVEDIVEHPTESETLLIAAHGVYKSTDGGRTWKEMRAGLPPIQPSSFAVLLSRLVYNEENPQEVYATVGKPENRKLVPSPIHLYKSVDGGESWTGVTTEGGMPDEAYICDFAVDPKDFTKMVAATTCGFYRSEDGGRNWIKAMGLPHDGTRRVGMSPSCPEVVYVTLGTCEMNGRWTGGVYRSEDGGRTFVERNGGLKQALHSGRSLRNSGYQALLVDEKNPDGVYLGAMSWTSGGLYRTDDGGRNWRRATPASDYRTEPGDGWHGVDYSPSVYSMSRSPFNAGVLAFGTEVTLDVTEDDGCRWEQRYTVSRKDGKSESNGLETTCVREIIPDLTRKGCFRLAYFDIGLWTTFDDGKTVESTFVNENHSAWACAQSPSEPNLVWQFCGRHGTHPSSVDRFKVSTDGGRTWRQTMTKDHEFLRAQTRDLRCLSDRAPYRLMARNRENGLVVSENGGVDWNLVSTNDLPIARRVTFFGYFEGVAYACGAPTSREPGVLWCSRDRGLSWQRLPTPSAGFGNINDLYAQGERILLTCASYFAEAIHRKYPGGAWLSEDGGATWVKVYASDACRSCALSNGRLLIGLGHSSYFDHFAVGGVVMSADEGETWISLNDESLQNPTINDIAVDPFDPDSIWVATQGNSVFVRRLPKTTVAPFKDGDRVVFVGDSITHHGRYMEQIALFYATRFPTADIWFSGSGESGGIMDGVRRRLGTDVVEKRPTVVTLMLGMNDVSRRNWPRVGETAENRKARDEAAFFYEKSAAAASKAIRERAGNPRIVYLTPSPYDQSCLVDGNPADLVCNDGLEKFAQIIRTQACREAAECVDLQNGLKQLNDRWQKADPAWSFMRSGSGAFDRIHPSEFGHQFLAYLFLKAQGVSPVVSGLVLDATAKRFTATANADVSDVSFDGKEIRFSAKELSLPYPFNAERRKACNYAPIIEDLNRQMFRVEGLEDGLYELAIDGVAVGRWTPRELSDGVNLAMNEKTPQYRQAQKVMEAMTEQWRNQMTIRDLLMWRLWRKHKGVPLDDMDAYRKWYAETYPNGPKEFYGRIAEVYLLNWERRAEIESAIEERRRDVRRLSQCVSHDWCLKKVEVSRGRVGK